MADVQCINKSNHTECPEGYLAWHNWAQKISKTHKQIKCQACGFLTIWIKKNKTR